MQAARTVSISALRPRGRRLRDALRWPSDVPPDDRFCQEGYQFILPSFFHTLTELEATVRDTFMDPETGAITYFLKRKTPNPRSKKRLSQVDEKWPAAEFRGQIRLKAKPKGSGQLVLCSAPRRCSAPASAAPA